MRSMLRALTLLGACASALVFPPAPSATHAAPAHCRCLLAACASPAKEQPSLVTSERLLDALESWLREQTVESVLPKEQAKELLVEFRDDRRFWAQQRRQFNSLWVSVEEGMRTEDRPLSAVLGPETSERLLDAAEEMEDDPMLVNSILRSEVVERLLGHILYEGIFEFFTTADILGNILSTLPLLGAIRLQMIKAARQQLDAILGDQVSRFLGGYTAAAAESAASYLLSDDTADIRRRARRTIAKKLLSKPIRELVEIPDIEMALVRDAVWSAIQEFRLPNEGTPPCSPCSVAFPPPPLLFLSLSSLPLLPLFPPFPLRPLLHCPSLLASVRR
jgi:hypothetical protein